jgi:hypothetical protein
MPLKTTTRIVHRSFREQLREAADAARATSAQDPWEPVLRQLKGRIGHDGVERIATAHAFDHLEIPTRRRPGLTVRLSRVMRSLDWSNIRARGLNPGSYRDRVRGFAREVPNTSGDCAIAEPVLIRGGSDEISD